MDVQNFNQEHITVTGTKAEFGFMGTSADAALAVSKENTASGVSHDVVSDDMVTGLKGRLAVVANEQGVMTARLSVGMAALVVRGAITGMERINAELAVFGADARKVTDPLYTRKAGFSAIIGALQPTLDRLKLDHINGNNS